MRKITLLLLAAVFYACSPKGGDGNVTEEEAAIEGSVQVDGSSTVYPITEAVAEEFNRAYPNARVTVGVSGTGGGFKKLIRKEVDITNASRPISENEIEQLQEAGVEFIELPVAYDGLAVVVNPENDFVDYLTVEELKKIWEPEAQGKITKWSQVREGWPDKEIRLFGPGTASGTFDYFTEAVVGEAKASRGDYTASEDDNVLVQGVAGDPNALGFFGLEYYLQNKNKLKIVPVDDLDPSTGKGPVVPSAETVEEGTYQPLSRPLFIYVRKESLDNRAVELFANFYIDNAADLVPDAGYIPLKEQTYDLVEKRLANRKAGSAFAALESNVGINMEEVLK